MKSIDKFLDNITMYRLVLWGLVILFGVSLVFSFFGLVGYTGFEIFVSLVVLLVSCFVSNVLFAKLWKAPRNVESVYITSFILLFVLSPSLVTSDLLWIALAGVIAMGSKYIFAIKRKHIFNPTAISAVILGIFGTGLAIWWIATPWMLLPVAVFGFLVLKKIQKFPLFFSFAITSCVIILLGMVVALPVSISGITSLILSYPFLFLGSVMLTEPLTTPPTKRLQIVYGVIVGVLFSFRFHLGPVYLTPALALVLGNIFSYIVSPKGKLKLSFVSMQKRSTSVYEFIFKPDRKPVFIPGQYLEWTLEHSPSDSRGNRRYFTIASSPTENHIHLGVRIDPEHSSSFKKKLFNLKPGEIMMAGSLEGDFVMPKDTTKKLVLIAGGVGITPFRSMVKYLKDTGEKRDIVVMYSCMTPSDFAFKEELEEAKNVGVKTVYIVTKPDATWAGYSGYVTPEIIKTEIGDYIERDFYLSGPNVMVENYENMLGEMGVTNIHTDYFPGY